MKRKRGTKRGSQRGEKRSEAQKAVAQKAGARAAEERITRLAEGVADPLRLPVQQQYERFVDEYWKDLNGTRAAIRAGYSERSAAAQASTLLRHPKVAELIELRRVQMASRYAQTRERMVEELMRLAFADPANVAVWGPHGVTLNSSEDLPPEVRSSIAEVSEHPTKDGGMSVRFKLHDKKGSLELLAKILGFTVERHVHGGDPKNPTPIRIGLSDEMAEQIRRKILGMDPKPGEPPAPSLPTPEVLGPNGLMAVPLPKT